MTLALDKRAVDALLTLLKYMADDLAEDIADERPESTRAKYLEAADCALQFARIAEQIGATELTTEFDRLSALIRGFAREVKP